MAVVEGYRHPELLAEPGWVLEHLDDADVRPIDCRKIEAYREAHIPGAVLLPTLEDPGAVSPLWLKNPTDPKHVMGLDDFAKLMGSAVDPATPPSSATRTLPCSQRDSGECSATTATRKPRF